MIGKHINHCEDSLTGCVFTHLLHLPSELFWQILRDCCSADSLPAHAGEPEVDPWPSWDGRDTGNSLRVVPDLFIRFPAFDLIVEAKRWDAHMHNPDQWRREIKAYLNEYGDENVPLKFIAVGVASDRDQSVVVDGKQFAVHMCRWSRLLDASKRLRNNLQQLDYRSSQTEANIRLLDSLIDLFDWHGVATLRWFKDFDFTKDRLSAYALEHAKTFRARSCELRTL